jgi:hypothetical protein
MTREMSRAIKCHIAPQPPPQGPKESLSCTKCYFVRHGSSLTEFIFTLKNLENQPRYSCQPRVFETLNQVGYK